MMMTMMMMMIIIIIIIIIIIQGTAQAHDRGNVTSRCTNSSTTVGLKSISEDTTHGLLSYWNIYKYFCGSVSTTVNWIV
jgi:uncharacterized membrane protein